MKRFLAVLSSAPVLGTIGLLLLSVLVWWVGPIVAIGSARPLAGVGARVGVLVVLWALWIGHLAYRAWRRRQANAALLAGIAQPDAADREAQVLAGRFRDAVARLKGASNRRSLFGGGDTLYDLPWYVFVGAPGSGKTTALLNAGLDFMLSEDGQAVRGVGGTRNCDWWFTREAVLIDTAGRYATQDSDKGVDAAAWDAFLALLRKTRPRRPINGVLLTVNVQDLLLQAAPERAEHAARLRARLQELQAKLGVRPPVYAVVTKADLVAGFMETFDALGQEGRDQVWGFSFDPGAAAADQPLRDFDAQYKALVERLAAGLPERLQAERDATRRAAMFGFAQEFAALGPLLFEFLGKVFGSGGQLQEPVALRGVYFTSGTQEGTPIDRVMGQLARSFGLERRSAAAATQQRGKSYFLRRLLQDLVFPEAHLVSFNAQAERRRTALRGAGFAAVALLGAAFAVGWAVSWARNQAYVERVAAKVPELQKAVAALPPATGADPLPLVPVLDAVRDAARPQGFAVAEPPLLDTLGLYQGGKLDAGARLGWHRLLDHALLPRIARRLEERLRASNKDNIEQAYEALKGYVMLYTPERFDADALRAWIGVDWDVQYRSLAAEQRAALAAHLDALLADGAPRSVPPMDAELVKSVRDLLASYPLEYRVYSRMKRQLRADVPAFSVAGAAGPRGADVFERASGQPLSAGVPGLYTREGYTKAFQGSLAPLVAQLAREEQWVLGRGGSAAKAALGSEVSERVRRLYLQDYVKAWDELLADVRLKRPASVAAAAETARTFSGVDSPLAAFVRAAAREITLVPAPKEPGVLEKAAIEANKARTELSKLADPQAAPASGEGPPERLVDDHFAALRRSAQGTPAPIDDAAKVFADLYTYLQAVDQAQKTKSPAPPPPPVPGAVKAALPAAAVAALDGLVEVGVKGARGADLVSIGGDLKPLYEYCQRAVANRYPFAPGSRADVLPEDFGDLFGAGGRFDDFFQRRLAALVDTGADPWAFKPAADGSKPASPAALADFQRAARIKDVFFRAGGRQPAIRLDVRVTEFGAGVAEVLLDVDGQATKFTAGNATPVTLAWPGARASSQIRLSLGGGTPASFEGPWALFRMFDRFQVQPSAQPERFAVLVNLDGRTAKLEVTANSVYNPFRLKEMQQFRCPGAL